MKPDFLSVHEALGYYTECNLATLERLLARKRVSACERERQQRICDGMVEACREFEVRPHRTYVRLAERLSSTSTTVHSSDSATTAPK